MTEAVALTLTEQRHEHAQKLAPMVPDSKIHILRDTIAPSLSPAQLELFILACERLRLDPFARQIHAVVRWEWNAEQGKKIPRMTIQVGIDGFRLIAERTGQYAGQGDPEWCGPDGEWTTVWLKPQPPAAARATVYRSGWDKPIRAVARWTAYVQTKQGGDPVAMWQRMGAEQLAKCAETLALRKAFPQELSGVYSDEEMGQADADRPQLTAAASQQQPEPKQQPEPRRERKDTPAPSQSPQPRFALSFPDQNFAGHPLSTATLDILEDYRLFLKNVLSSDKHTHLHKKAQKSLDEAIAEVDRRCAQQLPDPITQRLEMEVINRGGGSTNNDGDVNESWGFVNLPEE